MTLLPGLVRFLPITGASPLIGQPTSDDIDVGLAVRAGEPVAVAVFSGTSVLSPGQPTGTTAQIARLLSPLAQHEVGTIRCIGLNYVQHAKEANMSLPTVPVLFTKPATSLADPFPAPTIIPKHTVASDTADYESELVVVIGKSCKNVTEEEALDYVLGYTAGNDVSSREEQFAQSQWSYSKGFDGACPIGPTLVSRDLVPDPAKLVIKGFKNGKKMQDCGIE